MAAITLDIAGNTRQLDRDIQKTVNQVYTINLKTKGDQPLGRITGKVNEFNKSLDASNARVIAFGASAGIIFGVERAFGALVQATIEVQKSLQDINVILNASQQQLQAFGAELFSIARNTGQSFQEVAKAATEFSRQGLGVEETLKRTSEALILSRLSGLDAAKSVEALTAAVNSFASQSVTATEIVNKFATVDAAFAVSSADLANAIARVGSSAAQSGVSLNELIAIVTSAQQTTARGGAVIGNSFKTIFTRLQREKVVDLLESLGISSVDSSGQLKSTIQLLQDLGNVYDTLGAQQQSYVAEQVGGVFQINILKAALADLGKEYSIYSSALNVAAGATDQAIRRNEELNKTYAAQINALQENARQLAAAGGERLLGPSIDRLVGGTNVLLEGFNESDGKSVGAVLGKGILDGLGQFIAGPGLALLGGVLLKLFRDLGKFATGSVQQLLGLNTAASQQKDLQQSISQILSKNPDLLKLALQGQQGLNAAANTLLGSLRNQTVELQNQAQVAERIAKAFAAQAGVRVAGGVPVVPVGKQGKPGKAHGFIPNFSSDKIIEKYTAISLGASSSVRPHMSKGTIGGKKFVMNNQEIEFPGVGKNGDSMVIPTYGDGPRIAAAGFIPNFAYNKVLSTPTAQNTNPDAKFRGQNIGEVNLKDFKPREQNRIVNYQQKYGYLLPPGFGTGQLPGSQKFKVPPGIRFASPSPSAINKTSDPQEIAVQNDLEGFLLKKISQAVSQYTNTLSPLGKAVSPTAIEKEFGRNAIAGARGALRSITGSAFEVGITRALGYEAASRESGGDFDVRGGKNLAKVQELFGISAPLMDFKVSLSRRNVESFYEKIAKEEGLKGKEFSGIEKEQNARNIARQAIKDKYPNLYQERGFVPIQGLTPEQKKRLTQIELKLIQQIVRNRYTGLAAGFIPNFSTDQIANVMALESAMSGQEAVFSTKPFPHVRNKSQPTFASAMADHGGRSKALQDSFKGQKKAGLIRSSGFIPNFAETPESSAASIGTAATAIAAQLSTLAFTFAFSKNEVKASLEELAKSTKEGAQKQRKALADNIKQERREARKKSSLGGGAKEIIGADGKGTGKFTSSNRRAAVSAAGSQFSSQIAGAPSKNARPGFGAKARAFGGANAFGLAVAAPVLAQTISQAIPQESREGRIAATGVNALGNVAAATATGAIFGPVGAAVGFAAGALLEIPNVVKSFTTKVPELEKALSKSSTELTKFSEAGARLLSTSSELEAALSESNPSQEKVSKLTEQYAAALGELSIEDQNRLKSAQKSGKLEEEYAKVLAERTKELQGKELALALQKNSEDLGGGVAGLAGSENEKLLKSTFKNLLTGGKQDEKALQAVQKSAEAAIPQLEKLIPRVAAETNPAAWFGDVGMENISNDLRNVLNQVIPESETKADQINAILEAASQGPESLKNVIEDLIATYGEEAKSIKNIIDIRNAETARIKTEIAAKKEAVKATNQIIDSLERNIRMAQMAADTNRALSKANSEFQRNTVFADSFTRPTQTVSTIVGESAPLAQTFALKEAIAGIAFNQIQGIEDVKFTFVDDINESIKSAFNDAVGETTEKASTEGTAEEIRKANEQLLKPLTAQQENAFKVIQDVLNQSLAGAGNIETESILKNIEKSLKQAEISDKVIEKITTQVRDNATKGNLSIEKLRNDSINEFKTLAKEQTQKILVAKIGQAQGFGGGIEEFLTERDFGEDSLFDKVVESTKGFKDFYGSRRQGGPGDGRFDYRPGTNDFRYQYGLAQKARQEMLPDFGRAAINLIDQLQSFTGYTPNADGKAMRAGTAGLEQFYNEQIKELQDIAKNRNTPQIVKDEINAALQEVGRLGGVSNIAKIQVAQRTGSLTESGFKEITGKFQSPVLDALKQQALSMGGEEGAALLREIEVMSADMVISQDATVNAINITNSILNQILSIFGGERLNAATIEDQAAQSVTKKSTTAAVTPQKSTSQIEAETIARRNVAQGMGMTLQDFSTQFPNQIPQIGPKSLQELPDYKQYQELSRPGQKFASFDEVLTNWAKRDAFTRTGQIPNLQVTSNKPSQANSQNQVNQPSFTQQEAALNNNTSAITSLNENLRNLSTQLSEKNNENNGNSVANQAPGRAGIITGTQPNINTTTNAPVNVVVNAQGGSDIAAAVGEAVQNAIPTIIDKVKLAMGQKVPPKVSGPNMNMNIK